MSDLSTLMDELDAKLAEIKSAAVAAVAAVPAAVEQAPALVYPEDIDAAQDVPDAPLAADLAVVHARVDGVANALVAAVQSLDAKIDAGLDSASAYTLHPKVAAAALGGVATTVAAYVAQLNTVHIAGGSVSTAGAATLIAVIAGYLKKA